jgi:hypothetical protein
MGDPVSFILFLLGVFIIIGSVIYDSIGGGIVGAVVAAVGWGIGYKTGGGPE